MLEEVAYKFVNQSESDLNAIGYGLVILGAVVAGITNRSDIELARAPYFAYSALIVFLMSAVQVAWLQSLPAMAGGYLWVLMAVSLATSFLGGFFICKIAMARSRDAFGHGRMAALAFIPIANFWLLLKPSKETSSMRRVPTVPLMTGGWGALTGFALLIAAAVVTVYIEREAERMAEIAESDPASVQASMDAMIRSVGLEGTLRLIAAESQTQTPVTIDQVTTLERIEADGSQLRRTYVVEVALDEIAGEVRSSIASGVCAYEFFIPLMREGATILEVYLRPDGSLIGEVPVTRDLCGL